MGHGVGHSPPCQALQRVWTLHRDRQDMPPSSNEQGFPPFRVSCSYRWVCWPCVHVSVGHIYQDAARDHGEEEAAGEHRSPWSTQPCPISQVPISPHQPRGTHWDGDIPPICSQSMQ